MPESRMSLVRWVDSIHWIYFEADNSGDLTSAHLHSRATTQFHKVPFKPHDPLDIAVAEDTKLVNATHLMCVAADTSPSGKAKITLSDADFVNSQVRIYMFQPPLPEGSQIQECICSPDGTKIAYLVGVRSTSYIGKLYHRLNPSYHAVEMQTCSIWMSSTDGSQCREVGSLEASAVSLQTGEISQLDWSPKGDNLSFAYRNKIYVVDRSRLRVQKFTTSRFQQ